MCEREPEHCSHILLVWGVEQLNISPRGKRYLVTVDWISHTNLQLAVVNQVLNGAQWSDRRYMFGNAIDVEPEFLSNAHEIHGVERVEAYEFQAHVAAQLE